MQQLAFLQMTFLEALQLFMLFLLMSSGFGIGIILLAYVGVERSHWTNKKQTVIIILALAIIIVNSIILDRLYN